MARSSRPEAVAVLDVGKTNVKLLAISVDGRILSARTAPNVVARGQPYPHCNTDHIWRWMMAALADLGERFEILAIVPTSYGSTAALINEAELVLPVLDFEANPPAEIAAAYAEIAPWFKECWCPISPAGLTLGRQLLWQSRHFADAFGRARWILPFAQYWSWGLSGVPACEVTSIGAQTQLWNPLQRDYSSLARRQGWAELFPPMRNAWDVLGPLQFEIAEKCGLSTDVPVLCGIHDSNANFARYLAAGLEEFTLISTGRWLITFQPGLSLERLDPLRDTVSNSDLLGRPVACARFMGGREYEVLAGDTGAPATLADVEAVIAAGTMALPSFSNSGGPLPGTGGKGQIDGPAPTTDAERVALASLYAALMTSLELDLLGSSGRVIVDGGLAENELFRAVLAALRADQPIAISSEREGTALGAALLWGWSERRDPVPLQLSSVAPPVIAGLSEYAARWRDAAEGAMTLPAQRAASRRTMPGGGTAGHHP